MQSLVRPKVELENNGIKPAVNNAQAGSTQLTEIKGEVRYGVRPEEPDTNGRYIGELHGGVRHFNGVELPVNNEWKV
jgi:hypothetical protein